MKRKRIPDFSGVISIDEMTVLLRTTDVVIRRRLKDGTFPIPPIAGVDAPQRRRLRWWGPAVKAWLDSHAAREASDG